MSSFLRVVPRRVSVDVFYVRGGSNGEQQRYQILVPSFRCLVQRSASFLIPHINECGGTALWRRSLTVAVEKHSRALESPKMRREMQRRNAFCRHCSALAAMLQQQLAKRAVPMQRCPVERREAVIVPGVNGSSM